MRLPWHRVAAWQDDGICGLRRQMEGSVRSADMSLPWGRLYERLSLNRARRHGEAGGEKHADRKAKNDTLTDTVCALRLVYGWQDMAGAARKMTVCGQNGRHPSRAVGHVTGWKYALPGSF
ncbi:hypothetical protein NAI64_02845 [Oxalobacter sp. OxGP1]|uniref:hypothetical protein n=1 Tax=Oxalobacter paeniformigenes TaxID=2946594 RepID=UPI0022AF048C|nr:hypothetical protein [Oxalobacter paeniformigenes]MCZ4052662.1 hypothetical protein [Oxalobacter paeniformigenes]